jgi:hypothetical protein
MSKTPRTDKVWEKTKGHDATNPETWAASALDMRQECIKLETELTDMRKQFAEYVKAEDDWRDEFDGKKSDDLRIKASKLRKQAMGILGL